MIPQSHPSTYKMNSHYQTSPRAQVRELLSQYTEEVGQAFAPEVIDLLHKQTAGQPFLVNRCAQILTTELDIPKTRHHSEAPLLTSIYQADSKKEIPTLSILLQTSVETPRFEKMLMRIAFLWQQQLASRYMNEIVSELATYGIIARGEDGMCQILNPIYLHCIIQALRPLINGLEDQYFPEEGSH